MTNKYDGKGSFSKVAQPKKRGSAMWFIWGVCLAAAFSCFGSVGYTSYRQHVKATAQLQAEKTAIIEDAQSANVKKLMTVFPVYRETKQGKESQEKTMVKVNQSSLPTTITAGLDETVSPNPSGGGGSPVDYWKILKSGATVADSNTPGDWSVSSGGSVFIPADATYGKYTLQYEVSGEMTVDGVTNDVYYYVFKIVPPCPTGGTPSSSR